MIRDLDVWWDGALVGTLRLDEHGDLGFAYDEAWLADPARPPVSAHLPKRAEPFGRRDTRPFFAGLLPEQGQREIVARVLGVSKGNDFRLLEALGGDVAGALTLWPQGENPPGEAGLDGAVPLDDEALAGVLDTLPRRPLLAGEDGLRLSLAGAQPKLPVVLVNGAVALPAPGQPSTHILKPPMKDLPGITGNEAFAMTLARRAGLKVAAVEARIVRDRPFLLVERYDRRIGADGRIRRLHQEDFCQALGYAPENKYASDGGPGFRDCFDLVRRVCTPPAPSTLGLVDAAIFNVVLGNADAHSKNFSLLYADGGATLAPLYDLLCTAVYPDVAANLAMRIAKRARLEDFRDDTWARFAEDVGVGGAYVRRRAPLLAQRALDLAAEAADEVRAWGLASDQLDAVVATVGDRARRVLGE